MLMDEHSIDPVKGLYWWCLALAVDVGMEGRPVGCSTQLTWLIESNHIISTLVFILNFKTAIKYYFGDINNTLVNKQVRLREIKYLPFKTPTHTPLPLTCMCMHACMHIYTHTRTHTLYMHAHMHTHSKS